MLSKRVVAFSDNGYVRAGNKQDHETGRWWGTTGGKRDEWREGRVADFNMDAPASGCASDLSGRSYDPLSTDNAAASYRDRSRGSPIPLLRHVRPSRPSLSLPLVQAERRRALPPVISAAITLRVVFSTLVYVAATSSSHCTIWPADLRPVRSCSLIDLALIRDRNWFVLAGIYI